jgi:putative transcriptional regulator
MIEMSKLIEGTRMIFKLKEIRTGKELSQGQLARLCEMSVTNIQKYEQGRVSSIPLKTLDLFCEILECEPGDLIVRVKNGEASTV